MVEMCPLVDICQYLFNCGSYFHLITSDLANPSALQSNVIWPDMEDEGEVEERRRRHPEQPEMRKNNG